MKGLETLFKAFFIRCIATFDVLKKNLEECSLQGFVTRPGFEPRQAEPESAVLPLYYRAIVYFNPANVKNFSQKT
jgi:hypothetical protein